MRICDPGDDFARGKDVMLAEGNERLMFVLRCNEHFDEICRDLEVNLVQHVRINLNDFVQQRFFQWLARC
jgi:hypothetical protein